MRIGFRATRRLSFLAGGIATGVSAVAVRDNFPETFGSGIWGSGILKSISPERLATRIGFVRFAIPIHGSTRTRK